MNIKLKEQIIDLKTALAYAKGIETCDNYIDDGYRVDYYKAVRAEALENYATAIQKIIESSIDIAVEFEANKTCKEIFESLDSITKGYAKRNGITL